MAPPDVMVPRQPPKKQQQRVCKLESALASHLQRLYRDQGILVVEDERRVFYYCTACSKWAFTDASLADHLQGRTHRRVMATTPLSTQSPGSPWKLQNHTPASPPPTPLTTALSSEGLASAGGAADKGGSKRKRPSGAAAGGSKDAKESSGVKERGGLQQGSPGSLPRAGTGGTSNGHRYRSIGLPPWKRVPRSVPDLGPRAASLGSLHSQQDTQAELAVPKSASDPTPTPAPAPASTPAPELAPASTSAPADAPLLERQKAEGQTQHLPGLVYDGSESTDVGVGRPCEDHAASTDEVGAGTCPATAPLGAAFSSFQALEQSSMVEEPAAEGWSPEEVSGVLASASLLAQGVGLLVMDFSADLGRGKRCAGTCTASRAGAGCTCGALGHSEELPSATGKGDIEKDAEEPGKAGFQANEPGRKADEVSTQTSIAGTPDEKASARIDELGAKESGAQLEGGPGGCEVKGAARTRDRPEEHRLRRGKKASKSGKRGHGGKGLERQCFFCGQLMREGDKVAALWNTETQQPACSSRNDHGRFHIFHVDCIWDWVVFSASSIAKRQLVQPPSSLPGAGSGPPLLQATMPQAEKMDRGKGAVCENGSGRRSDKGGDEDQAPGDSEPQCGARDAGEPGSKVPSAMKADGGVPAGGEAGGDSSLSVSMFMDVDSGAGGEPPGEQAIPVELQAAGPTGTRDTSRQALHEQDAGEGLIPREQLLPGTLAESPRCPAAMTEIFCPECQGTGRRGAEGTLEHPRYRLSQVYDWIICVLLARNSAVPAADLSALSASATDAETVESDLLAHSLLRVRLEFSDVLMQQAICEASRHVKLFCHRAKVAAAEAC